MDHCLYATHTSEFSVQMKILCLTDPVRVAPRKIQCDRSIRFLCFLSSEHSPAQHVPATRKFPTPFHKNTRGTRASRPRACSITLHSGTRVTRSPANGASTTLKRRVSQRMVPLCAVFCFVPHIVVNNASEFHVCAQAHGNNCGNDDPHDLCEHLERSRGDSCSTTPSRDLQLCFTKLLFESRMQRIIWLWNLRKETCR